MSARIVATIAASYRCAATRRDHEKSRPEGRPFFGPNLVPNGSPRHERRKWAKQNRLRVGDQTPENAHIIQRTHTPPNDLACTRVSVCQSSWRQLPQRRGASGLRMRVEGEPSIGMHPCGSETPPGDFLVSPAELRMLINSQPRTSSARRPKCASLKLRPQKRSFDAY